MLDKLNQEQLNAAKAPLGHNLIIASAGTGKTSTIVARISYLLSSGISPDEILLLTFTNKASLEMISRLNLFFDKSITSKIVAGTFHSVSLDLLKKMQKKLILKQPSELKSLLKSILDRRRFDQIDDKKPFSASYLYDIYTLFNNKELNLSFYDYFVKNYEESANYAEIYDDVIKEFEEEKAKFGYGDFSDILLNLKKELSSFDKCFKEILVDEYQDTNSLQGDLIDKFKTKSLFCVGDFDQSIYAFNGANIEIIANFKNRYKDAKIFSLNINYRSSASILALANKVINNNPRLYEKKLVVGKKSDDVPPKLLIYEDSDLQSVGIIKLIKESNINYDDIAIIFRNNSSADRMEIKLKEYDIPSIKKGGISIFDAKEIKIFLNLVSLLINDKDLMAFIQLFEFIPNLGEAGAKEIFENLLKLGGGVKNGLLNPNLEAKIFEPRKKNYQLGLFDEFQKTANAKRYENLNIDGNFKKNPILKFNRLNEGSVIFLNDLFMFFKNFNKNLTLIEQLNYIKSSAIFKTLINFLANKRSQDKNFKINEEKKAKELEKIYNKIDYLKSFKYDDLEKFYNFLTLGSKELSNQKGVNLLSIHASKGLEFEMVFIIDLANDRFPNKKLISLGGSLEEERRLFYVAVTRAKSRLFLTFAKKDFNKKTTFEPSIFLKEAGFIK